MISTLYTRGDSMHTMEFGVVSGQIYAGFSHALYILASSLLATAAALFAYAFCCRCRLRVAVSSFLGLCICAIANHLFRASLAT